MRDADNLTPLQRDVARRAARSSSRRVTDAAGGVAGLHRPGYRLLADGSPRNELHDAYQRYDSEAANAWRGNPPTGAGSNGPPDVLLAEGSVCTVKNVKYQAHFGAPGHLVYETGDSGRRELVCRPDVLGKQDALTVQQMYQIYDQEISAAWRGAPPTGFGSANPDQRQRDDDAADSPEAAYSDYDRLLVDAWRSPT